MDIIEYLFVGWCVMLCVDFSLFIEVRNSCIDNHIIVDRLCNDVIKDHLGTSIPRHFLSSQLAINKQWVKTENVFGSSCRSQFNICLCNFIRQSIILQSK
jgi:hypothetical protein